MQSSGALPCTPVMQLFSDFEDEPVASGSIAQIHKGKLSHAAAVSSGAKPGKVVAIKVRAAPGVAKLWWWPSEQSLQRARLSCGGGHRCAARSWWWPSRQNWWWVWLSC